MRLFEVTNRFILHKKSLGLIVRTSACILRRFCKAMGDIDIADVDPRRVRAFLDGAGPVTRNWHRKNEALRSFYRFALARHYVVCSPLPTSIPKAPSALVPYIFSHDELRRLLAATAVQSGLIYKLQAETLRPFILTLYGAGLRVSEALSLNLGDVDLESGLLLIRKTKFHKTRFVPIGSSLLKVLSAYAARPSADPHLAKADAPFFTYRTGERLKLVTVDDAFDRLRRIARVRRTDGGRYQPRLHDLRHTFSVHRLVSWYRQGADVQRLLPQLATYLGHACLSSTQRYLTMTSELLREAGNRFGRYAQEVSHV
jgi:integrase/recombinase XerD